MDALTAALIAVEENADLLRGAPGETGKAGRPGISGKAGDPGLVWRGTFRFGETYQPGDVVEWEGSSYVALVTTARRPPDTEWDLLAAKGEPGASGRGYIRGGGGTAGVTDHGALTGLADDDHPQYTTDAEATVLAAAEVTTHAAAGDPHTGYRLESANHTHASSGLQGGKLTGWSEVSLAAAAGGGNSGASLELHDGEAGSGGGTNLDGGGGAAGEAGGSAIVRGGDGDAGNDAGAAITLAGGSGSGTGGSATIEAGDVGSNGGATLTATGADSGGGGGFTLTGGNGGAGSGGGGFTLTAGTGNDETTAGAILSLGAGNAVATHGKASLTTNNTTGSAGQVLTAQGDTTALWATPDATLTALAAANWAANAVPIGSGVDTLSQVAFAANTFPARASSGNLVAKTITDFGLSLVDDAAASNARTTLGLGTAAVAATGDFEAAGGIATHAAAADPHTGYVREADANWIDLTDSGATTLHSHAGGAVTWISIARWGL